MMGHIFITLYKLMIGKAIEGLFVTGELDN